jgi:hypothetical protein
MRVDGSRAKAGEEATGGAADGDEVAEYDGGTIGALRERLRQAEEEGTVLASQLMRAREDLLNEVSGLACLML